MDKLHAECTIDDDPDADVDDPAELIPDDCLAYDLPWIDEEVVETDSRQFNLEPNDAIQCTDDIDELALGLVPEELFLFDLPWMIEEEVVHTSSG